MISDYPLVILTQTKKRQINIFMSIPETEFPIVIFCSEDEFCIAEA